MNKDYSSYFQLPNQKDAARRSRTPADIRREPLVISTELRRFAHGKTYRIQTFGCQANERDGETLAGILESIGYVPVVEPAIPDVWLLNTCAIRENAEQRVFGLIGAAKQHKRTHPDMIFGVCGCMPQEEHVVLRLLERYPHVDLIFGTHNIPRLPQFLHDAYFNKERIIEVESTEGVVFEDLPVRRDHTKKAWVNIIYGCDKFCTYCIVPYTRGKERSRLPQDILEEVRELHAQGYQEITLLGQNVNAYGKDLVSPYPFASLLRDVAEVGIPRVRFMTSHPWDFSQEMVDTLAQYKNLMPAVHLPVQSGDDDILRRMGRRYTAQSYLALYHSLRLALPQGSITTDIIVGFPGETEEQFNHTLALVEQCQFDAAYTFLYSPREGTPAAKMVDDVSLEVKKERFQRLTKVVAAAAHQRNQAYLQRIVPVLVEGPSKRNPSILSGYSDTNKLVNFKGDPATIGTIVPVKITAIKSWTLEGEMVHE